MLNTNTLKSILKKSVENYMPDDIQLAKAILGAFSKLYNYDKYLIINKPDASEDTVGSNHHVGERAIVFRFAYYLQKILDEHKLYSDYNLDCEYNRNGDKPKHIISLDKNVYPDLIIHKRGETNNLLVMEFKTYWNTDQENDIQKIKAFLDSQEKESYNYKYGIAVLIEKEKVNLKLVENNQIYEDERVYK